jgi:serine/threonine protein kinase
LKPPLPPSRDTECPSAQQLRAFSAAQLPRDVMDAVEHHVGRCDACLSALEKWDEDSDVLIQALAALPSNPDDEAEFQHLQIQLLVTTSHQADIDQPTTTYAPTGKTRDTEESPDRLGGYQLLELIGQGATGAVFRAKHVKLDRMVAIKVLNSHCVGHDSQAVRRFQHEMRAVGQLNHAHIVRATDAGEDSGRHYLVMEYVEGIDASRLLKMVGPLRVADACEIARQAALALDFAHRHDMVHRDVKPSNLLFSFDGHVRLLDLGLVRNDRQESEAANAWQINAPHGTAEYMPPEQWTRFADVDARADIYSLGCTLYKLLTGEPLFPGLRGNYAAAMEAHLSAAVPMIRDRRPEVPLGLQKVIGRMVAKKPEARYATAAEVAQHLETFAQGARLQALGTRLATTTPEERRIASTDSPTVDSEREQWRRRRQRRRWLTTVAATSLSLSGLALWYLRHPSNPQLRAGTWRSLHPLDPPRSFPSVASTATSTQPSSELRAIRDTFQLTAAHDTLFTLGQPVQGTFALRAQFHCQPGFERLGLFFRYRPQRDSSSISHPFQTIEVMENDAGGVRLLWSQYRFVTAGSPAYVREYTPWAEVSIDWTPQSKTPVDLVVVLGRSGFPEVTWNGNSLHESLWTLSWRARHMSRLTQDELERAYLGRLGIFARAATATCSHLQLRYLDEQETL